MSNNKENAERRLCCIVFVQDHQHDCGIFLFVVLCVNFFLQWWKHFIWAFCSLWCSASPFQNKIMKVICSYDFTLVSWIISMENWRLMLNCSMFLRISFYSLGRLNGPYVLCVHKMFFFSSKCLCFLKWSHSQFKRVYWE